MIEVALDHPDDTDPLPCNPPKSPPTPAPPAVCIPPEDTTSTGKAVSTSYGGTDDTYSLVSPTPGVEGTASGAGLSPASNAARRRLA